MGWASASDIFDPVAKALIEEEASPDLKRHVLYGLLGYLLGADWDTAWDSLQQFGDDLVTRSVFYQHRIGVRFHKPEHPEGELGYDDDADRWTLRCDECGPVMLADFTAAGHDSLVRDWPEHVATAHGAQVAVETWKLINPPAAAGN